MRRGILLLLGLGLTAGCESDDGLKKYTEPPVVAIETPVDGASVDEGVTVSMRGRVVDEVFSDSLSAIKPTWSVNGATVCEGAVFDVSGLSECSTVFERGDATITLSATNPDGQTANASVAITVNKNEAPTAEIVQPELGGEYYSNGLTLFEGSVSDGEDLAENMTVEWTSSLDGVLPFSANPSSDGNTTGTFALSAGDHQITLTVTDTTGRTGTDTTTITVEEGSKPTINLLAPVSGDVFNVDDAVSFVAEVNDMEDSVDTLSLSWESDIDGVFSTQGAGSDGTADFSYSALSHGAHTVTVTVTDSDGLTGRDSATIYVNAAPEAPVVHIDPDPAGSDDALAVTIDTPSADLDGDTITYAYHWYLNGVDTGLTANPLPASVTTRGDVWSVYVIPNDGVVDGAAGIDSVTIGNGAPTLSSVTITPTVAYTDDTLTAVPAGFADPDGDAEGYHYQWYKNGVAIAGATDSTLSGTEFDHFDSITVDVQPYDGTEDGATVTSGARVIQNTPPTDPTVDLTPNNPEDDDDLLCTVTTASSDVDADAITYTYAWTTDGIVSAYTTDSVPASATSDGETWACLVYANDGTDSSATVSDSVLVGDYTAPDAPVLDAIAGYRNEDSATITGSAEPFSTVTLYTSSASGVVTATATANGAGTFSFAVTLTLGEDYTFYATAEDAAGNTSGLSNVLTTEVCDPGDDYEDATTYGDSCTDPIVDWSTLAEDGTSEIAFTGNLLDSADADWYLIQATDDLVEGLNYFRLHVELTAGSSEYGFVVYRGGCTTDYLQCATTSTSDPEGTGYTEYEFYAEDAGEGYHSVPSDTRACYTSHGEYNNCEDLGGDYYIKVVRTTSAYSCTPYSLSIKNGAW